MVLLEFISGTMELVEYVKYSNGREVKRILNKKTRVPMDIIEVSKPRTKGTR
jgi:hypothetical protein